MLTNTRMNYGPWVRRRRKHKVEVTALQQQLKSTSMGAKGGAATAERLQKELEKTRCVICRIQHAILLSGIDAAALHRTWALALDAHFSKIRSRGACRRGPAEQPTVGRGKLRHSRGVCVQQEEAAEAGGGAAGCQDGPYCTFDSNFDKCFGQCTCLRVSLRSEKL